MTAKRRQTLEERVSERAVRARKQTNGMGCLTEAWLIRAELDRLARGIRKEIKATAKLITPMTSTRERDTLEGRMAGCEDALEQIKQAKR